MATKKLFNCKLIFLWWFLLLPISITYLTNAARILGIATHPGKSHFDFFRPLFLGLAKAGHDVRVLSFFPNKQPIENYTDYQLTGMPIFTDIVDIQIFENEFEIDWFPIKIATFFIIHNWGLESCRVALSSPHIKRILDSGEKYDAVVMEQFNNDCMISIAHKLGAPVISLSSCALMPWHYKRMGSPMVLSHMPMNFLPHAEKMTLLQRINNFLHFHSVNALYDYITQPATNAILREHFGPTIPRIEEMVKTTSAILLNQHYSLAGAYPYTPNIFEVGGLQIEDEKPLEPDLKSLLDNSPRKGVIYISLGSMIRPETLSPEKREDLMRVITQFSDYLFLLKWPDNHLATKPANLVTRPWMPQRDILCHPKVRAFMTHGGLLGTSEGVYCGVPMLVTPFYGDQFVNSMAISNRKLGIVVKYKDLTERNIVSALTTILSPSFRANVRQTAEVYRNRPMKPLDLAIWLVENVVKTGGIPLAQSPSIELSALAYYSMDVYIILTLVTVLILLILRTVVKFILRTLRGTLGEKSKGKKD